MEPYRVGFLLIDDFALLSYASAIEPLRAANEIAGRTLYAVKHLPVSGARSVCSAGAEMRATAHVGETVDFDLVLVVAGADPTGFSDRRVFTWLRLLRERGVALGGISGGTVVLARAGVVGERRVTVHWEHAAYLAEAHPELLLERGTYVFDRDRMTCAGERRRWT